jgi:glutamate-1-semialdehyde 2,1-aminomutase
MGLIPPAPGFLQGLRRACDEVGALLIFDEVITGFRIAPGSAAARFGVQPDLYCLGKVVGGGLPLAAVAGAAAAMELLAPVGPVYQAGTLAGNPLATAAGLAVLELLGPSVYDELERTVATLAAGIGGALADAGLAAQVPVCSTLCGVFFGAAPVTDYEGARHAAAGGDYARFFRAMLARGVALAPSPYEVMFCSLAHGEREVEATVAAATAAAREVAAAR